MELIKMIEKYNIKGKGIDYLEKQRWSNLPLPRKLLYEGGEGDV